MSSQPTQLFLFFLLFLFSESWLDKNTQRITFNQLTTALKVAIFMDVSSGTLETFQRNIGKRHSCQNNSEKTVGHQCPR